MIVFDIETNGLLEEVTKLHCLSYTKFTYEEIIEQKSITSSQVLDFLEENKEETLIGHNIVLYDIPVLEKLFNFKVENELYDTLWLSRYLYPKRTRHGLEEWGETFGIPKPKIEDWSNRSLEEYIHRCEEDVKINLELYSRILKKLTAIYGKGSDIKTIQKYLAFIPDCLRDQEEGIPLDINLVNKSLMDLEFQLEQKETKLKSIMPVQVLKEEPKKRYKKDGTLSSKGIQWEAYVKSLGLPKSTSTVYKDGNPKSHSQVKEWLFDLGWEPTTFETSPATGQEIPKVTVKGKLCNSVKKLYDKAPELEELEGLYKITHRIGIFKAFRDCYKNGKIISSAHGITNTLRLMHKKPVVNLPGYHSFYGKEIRGSLCVSSDDYLMCGSDISGLEDCTKQHYMYFFDPEYVINMRVPGFDPHLDIAMLAGMMSKHDTDNFKKLKKVEELTEDEKTLFDRLNKIRSNAKTVNFAGVYGAGPAKIAKTLGSDLAFAENLHKTYWKRNISVKQVADSAKIKRIGKELWLYNPVSKFWYSLREEKDKFSTLNQGTGAYVFTLWLRFVREAFKPLGIKVLLQYHDELLFICRKELKAQASQILKDSMQKVNDKLKLNVPIDISIDWGKNYAECH